MQEPHPLCSTLQTGLLGAFWTGITGYELESLGVMKMQEWDLCFCYVCFTTASWKHRHEHMHAGWMKHAIRLHFSSRELEIAKSLQPNDSLFPGSVFMATCLYTGKILPANSDPKSMWHNKVCWDGKLSVWSRIKAGRRYFVFYPKPASV